MTDTPMKVVVDCSTGKQQHIPLSAEEIAQRDADALAFQAQEAERLALEAAESEAQASAVSKLTALGLTAEEIAALKS